MARFTSFLKRQFKDIANRNFSVLLGKLEYLLLLPVAFLVVLTVWLLRPIKLIRFGALYGKRIGHFASNPEIYLCERDAGLQKKDAWDIFYYVKPISNYQLKKMWDRMFFISPFSKLTYLADRINRLLPFGWMHAVPLELIKDMDPEGFFTSTTAHLYFTAEEEEKGKRALKAMGVAEDVDFICFHSRDSAYLENAFSAKDWRFQDYRNSQIKNYIPAAEELVRRGYFVFRMGAVVREALDSSHTRLIDYASKYRTDFMDIYLSAKCRFFISSNSGISIVATVFRKPVVYVNFIPLEYAYGWSPITLFIPKKLWLRREKRFLTFREILDLGIGRKWSGKYRGKIYDEAGIEIIENTHEEIASVALEMDERLKGAWHTNREDEELQRHFWSLFTIERLPDGMRKSKKNTARIGSEFLRQNKALLN